MGTGCILKMVTQHNFFIKMGAETKSFVCNNVRWKRKIRKIPVLRKRGIYRPSYATFSMKRFFLTSVYVKESLLMYFLFCCVHTNDNNSANILEQTHFYVKIYFINASKPVKTCHVFHADIVKFCKMYSAKISVYTSKCNRVRSPLLMILCHMLRFTPAYFFLLRAKFRKKKLLVRTSPKETKVDMLS